MPLVATITSRPEAAYIDRDDLDRCESLAGRIGVRPSDLDDRILDRCEQTAVQTLHEQGPALDMPFEDLQDLAYAVSVGFGEDVLSAGLRERIAFLLGEFSPSTVHIMLLEAAGIDPELDDLLTMA